MIFNGNLKINNEYYPVFINKKTNKKLVNNDSKINLGLVISLFKLSNTSLFKDGINALIVESDKYTNVNNCIIFSFESKTKRIIIFKIANKYIPNKSILSYQFINSIDICSYKQKTNKISCINKQYVKPIHGKSLKILAKIKDKLCPQ